MATGIAHQHVLDRCDKIMRNFKGNQQVVGVEVGVFGGQLSSTLMAVYPNLKLYGIDPYRCFSMRDGWPQERWDNLHDDVVRMMSQFGDRWQLIRKPSLEARGCLPYLVDFIYLDGDHSYDMLDAEIRLYEPVVAGGGILGGHDYSTAYPGVMKAVDEYAIIYDRPVRIEAVESMWWWPMRS